MHRRVKIHKIHKTAFYYICRMNFSENQTVKIAILDLYEGHENQGMRGIREN